MCPYHPINSSVWGAFVLKIHVHPVIRGQMDRQHESLFSSFASVKIDFPSKKFVPIFSTKIGSAVPFRLEDHPVHPDNPANPVEEAFLWFPNPSSAEFFLSEDLQLPVSIAVGRDVVFPW